MWLHLPPSAIASAESETIADGQPSTESPCAQASAGSTLPSALRFADFAASLTWRGKPAQPQALQRAWKQGGFIRLLSGLTLEPLTAARGAELWISSLAATRASQTALPESAAAPMMTDSLSTRWCGSSRSAGLIVCSAKTCRGTQTGSLPPSSRHWSDWAIALRQEFSARVKPATATAESGFSSWPTCRVVRGGYTRDNGDPAKERPSLDGVAEQWMTPNVPNGGRSAAHAEMKGRTALHNGKKVQIGLEYQAKDWPTPSDISKRGGSQPAAKRRAGNHAVNIEDAAEHWPTPMASDNGQKATKASHQQMLCNVVQGLDPLSFPAPAMPDGQNCSGDGQSSLQPSTKRRLNPLFVEALMRWPTGLSGFDTAATGLTLWRARMRIFILTLCNSAAAQQSVQPGLFE